MRAQSKKLELLCAGLALFSLFVGVAAHAQDVSFAGMSVHYEVDVLPYSIAVGDFNGDGVQDLAVACRGTRYLTIFDGFVVILLGNGDGSFRRAGRYEVAFRPTSIALGDFNGELAAGVVGFPADPRIRRAACLAAAGQIVAEADQKWIVASLGCRLEVALALHRGRHIRVGVLVRGVADLDSVRILAIQIDEVPTVDIPGPAADLGYAVRGVLGLLVSVVGGRGGRRGFGRRGQVVLTNARGEK